MHGQANIARQLPKCATPRTDSSAPAPSGKMSRLQEPKSKRQLTRGEQILLLKGSKLNKSIFPPWKSPLDDSEFELLPGQAQYLDDAELGLSETQLEVFDRWRRPDEIIEASHSTKNLSPAMGTDCRVDLVQDITSDCSVVASLCAVTSREERGHSNVISCNLYPYNNSFQQPTISPNGKYVLRLFFNGCSRRVVIDDRLPASRTSRNLHVVDRNHPTLLWPALVEKAYLKIRGGYDFPGSNSGTDLHVLTGWIPEQLFLQSDDISRGALWRRIHNAFNYGDVLITMGTGKLTFSEQEGLGLAGEHDYAVIDMKEQDGQQLFLVKNPWSEGTVWKGHIYRREISNIVRSLSDLNIQPGTDTLAQGTFWMGLNDVFQSFDSIYLNWNPGLFSFREDIHFEWDLATCANPEGSLMSNPQYEIRSGAGGTVWLLLSKHFPPTIEGSSTNWKANALAPSPKEGFISLYAFDNDGEKVFLSDGATVAGPYVDSPNTLLKLELTANRAQTIVVSEQALPRSNHTFTLSVYSLRGLTISKPREKFSHCVVKKGAWKSSTAGGNTSGPMYHTNPQYSLSLANTSDVALLLENPVQGFPIHVQLVWAGGKQIHAITNRDIAGDSGEYKKGYAFANIHNVQAGAYTIVCSTFEEGQLGQFTLRVCSTSACTVSHILGETAGRFLTTVRAAEFAPGHDRLLAPMISRRLNRVSVSARPFGGTSGSGGNPQSPLKLALEYGRGPSKQILAISGDDEYIGGPAGVQIGDVDIHPEMCQGRGVWVVIERLGSTGLQHDEYVEVKTLSDGPLELGGWHVREGM